MMSDMGGQYQPGQDLPKPDDVVGGGNAGPPTSSNPTNPVPAVPPPIPNQAQPSNSPTSTAVPTPNLADDSDLIEQEWVNKAKNIVNATRNDPHSQNEQINQFKADYIKKRYNKDIKQSES